MHWGTIVCEAKIANEPEALVRYFDELELSVGRIGLEAGHCRNGSMPGLWPLADAVLLKTRRVKAALSAVEERPEGCTRDSPIAADGMEPPDSCQIGDLQGYPSPFSVWVPSGCSTVEPGRIFRHDLRLGGVRPVPTPDRPFRNFLPHNRSPRSAPCTCSIHLRQLR